MKQSSKIFVASSNGLVGSAIVRRLQAGGYTNLITPEIDELDLTDAKVVAAFFAAEKPEYVILAAAKVGGIHANNTYPAVNDKNLVMHTLVYLAKSKKRPCCKR